MNLAALWQLPVLFCCENNLYAMGTRARRAQSQTDLAMKAASYGMPALAVDGMDVLAVEAAAQRSRGSRSAVAAARTSWNADLPLPRSLDVRPGPLPRQGRGRGVEEARSDRGPLTV